MLENVLVKKFDQKIFIEKQPDKSRLGTLLNIILKYINVKQVVVLFFVLFLLGCRIFESNSNQKQPSVSLSGKYILTLPIEINPDVHERFGVWKVTIKDNTGKLLYKDTSSTFIGTLNVYWLWDKDDRVWLYNSDDGQIWFWEVNEENWVKTNWGRIDLNGKSEKIIERNIERPKMLYPYKNKE